MHINSISFSATKTNKVIDGSKKVGNLFSQGVNLLDRHLGPSKASTEAARNTDSFKARRQIILPDDDDGIGTRTLDTESDT